MRDTKLKHKLEDEGLPALFKKHPVVFAYLFGSQARGKTGALSDLDIAVYFNLSRRDRDYFKFKLHLIGELNEFFKTDRIDLVVLNDVPPLLAHRILKEGKVIFSRNEKQRLQYEVNAVLRYLDWKPYLEKYTQAAFGGKG